jgi:hypothetical protein
MKGAGHAALALELADVTDIDESHIVASMQRDGVFDRERLDLAFGGIDERAKPGGDFLRHQIVSRNRIASGRHYTKAG